MDDATLILKIRAEALRANLDRIKGLQEVPNRRTDLDKLAGQINEVRNLLLDARLLVSNAKLATLDPLPGVSQKLAEAEAKMEEVRVGHQAADVQINLIRQKCFPIQEPGIGKDIGKDLTSRIAPRIQALVLFEANLDKPAVDLKQQWEIFGIKATEINQEVFAQYIEFLRGLALRDTGFDAGISQIADELIQIYPADRMNFEQTLAIPIRREVAMKLARIVGVRFPDWTIWALPSIAHEFWNVVPKNDIQVQSSLQFQLQQLTGNDLDEVESRFNDCLGDAFATYTMGPAYAFFAIFLLLDPSSPFTSEAGRPAHDVRAHTICQMLECMDFQESPLEGPYSEVRERLKAAWEKAIVQTGAQPKIEEKQVADDKLRATNLVKALWTTLKGSTSPPFTVEIWNDINGWVAPLLKGEVDQIPMPHGAELRHVLNAVWLARVHPDRKKDITDIAYKLAQRINRSTKK
jgi:hypothetical protein